MGFEIQQFESGLSLLISLMPLGKLLTFPELACSFENGNSNKYLFRVSEMLYMKHLATCFKT